MDFDWRGMLIGMAVLAGALAVGLGIGLLHEKRAAKKNQKRGQTKWTRGNGGSSGEK